MKKLTYRLSCIKKRKFCGKDMSLQDMFCLSSSVIKNIVFRVTVRTHIDYRDVHVNFIIKIIYLSRSKIKFSVLFFYHAHRYIISPWNKLSCVQPERETVRWRLHVEQHYSLARVALKGDTMDLHPVLLHNPMLRGKPYIHTSDSVQR
jgi:hypothetical protein